MVGEYGPRCFNWMILTPYQAIKLGPPLNLKHLQTIDLMQLNWWFLSLIG